MSIFRRRRLPPDLETVYRRFLEVNARVEEAKEAIVAAVPQARLPGRPLPEAVAHCAALLGQAEDRMTSWFDSRVSGPWHACGDGLKEAAERAARLGETGGGLGFEALLDAAQNVLDPLDAFEDADEAFRRLRR